MSAARYIERNPVRAGLVDRARDWPYSSAAAHGNRRDDELAEGDGLQELMAGWVCTWAEWLADRDDEGIGKRLARHEATGRPLGQRPFLERLSALPGRDLVPRKPGPKQKQKHSDRGVR